MPPRQRSNHLHDLLRAIEEERIDGGEQHAEQGSGHLEGGDQHGEVHRLRRIEGQIRGLQRMVEEDAYCIAVLTQILVFPLFGLRTSLAANLAIR